MSKINNAVAMSFIKIGEEYPNDYILVKIVEIDHEKCRQIGIAICTASTYSELVDYAKKEDLIYTTTILTGDNLVPMIGGLL